MTIRARRSAAIGAVLVIIGVVIGFFSACGGTSVAVTEASGVDDRLSSLKDSGDYIRLDELLTGNWDEVRIFGKGSRSRGGLEKEFGQSLDMPEYYYGKGTAILVLLYGRVISGISIDAYLTPGIYDRETVVMYDDKSQELKLTRQRADLNQTPPS